MAKEDDYTRYRTVGDIPYEVDDKIGRSDSRDRVAITAMTLSTTAVPLPANALDRRSHIKVINMDVANNVAILTVSGTYADGYSIPHTGGSWEDDTDAIFWIVAASGTPDVRVYEKSERFNYN